MPQSLILRDENFTPQTRTPWGGTRITSRLKPGLAGAPRVVGESWEVSVEPDFPSRVETGEGLAEVIARAPEAWLGAVGAARGGAALLMKLLDAATPLSVQIHPRDDWPGLAPGESGKPECWYIVEADPGAALLLGLAEGVTRETLTEALRAQGDVEAKLARVEVSAGDFLVIDAGVVHAVGAGITLVEPQRVLPGRRGVTLRFWDYDRRYDANGAPSPEGQPRELHVADALAVTDFEAPRGKAGLALRRMRAGRVDAQGSARSERLLPPARDPDADALLVSRLGGTGNTALDACHAGRLVGLVVLAGEVRIAADDLVVPAGRSAVIPAALLDRRLELSGAHAIAASVA